MGCFANLIKHGRIKTRMKMMIVKHKTSSRTDFRVRFSPNKIVLIKVLEECSHTNFFLNLNYLSGHWTPSAAHPGNLTFIGQGFVGSQTQTWGTLPPFSQRVLTKTELLSFSFQMGHRKTSSDVLNINQLIHQDDWVNDAERHRCNVCTRNFGSFRRKHHCRRVRKKER